MTKLTKSEARQLIDALGGPAALARDLGIGLSTVAYWKTEGTIPRWRWPAVAGVADAKQVALPAALNRTSAAA